MTSRLKVEYRSVDKLIPYINNARTHSDKQVTQIAASIKEFGFNDPIGLDGDNGIIEGHGRLLAAKKLNMKEVPCIELSHLSDTQKKAYILAHNKIALNAGWDEELFAAEIQALKDLNFDVELTGFEDGDGEAKAPKEPKDLSGEICETFEVIVECASEDLQQATFEKLVEEGYICRVLTL